MASDDSVVVAALSVEEAIIVGLTRLTATRDEVDIEILDEGTRGFLGIGAREARVQLTRRSQTGVVTPIPAAPVAPKPVIEPSVPQTTKTKETVAAFAEPVEHASPASGVSATPDAAPVTRSVPVAERVSPEPVVASASEEQRAPRSAEDGGDLDRDAIVAAARDVMEHLLPGMSVDIEIEWVDEDRPTLWVSLTGRDADSLVGPRARNLHSLQYLFRALIYQQADGNYNVVVDADGYRRRRRRSLESLAQKKADQAVEQGQAIQLRAMPAHERRIIHMLLKEDDRVSTESTGKGRDRAITIVPNKSSSQDRS